MSTDHDMDELLRDAGSRWRAANPGSPPSVDFASVTPPGQPPRRNRWLVAAAAAVVVAGVAAGGTWLGTHRTHDNAQGSGKGIPEQTTWGGLTGTDWKIFEVTKETNNNIDTSGVEGSEASLHIHSDGSFTGNDGCNTIFGTVQISVSTMTFGDVGSTLIGCTGEVGKTSSTIDAILKGQVTWSVNDAGGSNDLFVEHAGVGSLIYFGDKPPSTPVTDPSAVAGTWELTEYEQNDSTGGSGGSASGTGSPTGFGDLLVIDADGTFKVQHRCYADAGHVLFGDGKATWSEVHPAGAIPCPTSPTDDPKDEQDRNALVDGVLKGETAWKIDNGQLRIAKGGNTIVYSPYAHDTMPSGGPTK